MSLENDITLLCNAVLKLRNTYATIALSNIYGDI